MDIKSVVRAERRVEIEEWLKKGRVDPRERRYFLQHFDKLTHEMAEKLYDIFRSAHSRKGKKAEVMEVIGSDVLAIVNAVVNTAGYPIQTRPLVRGGRVVQWHGLIVHPARFKKIERMLTEHYTSFKVEMVQNVEPDDTTKSGLYIRIKARGHDRRN